MTRYLAVAVAVAMILASSAAQARQVEVIQPLAIPAGQPVQIIGLDLYFAPDMQAELDESDAKAAHKRSAAGLPTLDRASYAVGPQDAATYATLPFKQMFPLVIRDVTREWKLNSGIPVKLKITLDRLKTADAALALLAGSSDMLEGNVIVIDTVSNRPLGSFRVEVRNTHSGWGGMLMRGAGVREKLAEEFGLELSRQISGLKRKPS